MLQLSVWAVFCFACAAKHGVNAGVVERFRRGEPSGGPELQLQGSVARQTPTKNAFFPRKPSDELPLSFSEGLGGDASDPILEASAGPSGEPDATLEQGRPRPPDGEPSTKERQIPARQHTASPRGTRWLPYQRQQSRTASRRRRLEDVISTLRAEKEKMNTSAETSPQRVAIPRPAAAAGPSWGTPGTQSSAGGSPQRQVTPLSLEAVYTILQRAAAWVASRPSPFEKEPTVQAFATILSQYERFKLRVNRPAPEEKELVAGRVLGAGGMGVVFECWDPAAGAMYACKLSWLRPIPGASLTPKVVTMGMRKSIEEETAINSILGPSLSPETLRDQYALVVPSFSGHIVEKAGKPVYSYLLTSAFSRPFYNQVIGFWPAAASLIDVAMTPFITLDVSLFLVRRVIEIIAGLHSLGVVHADIKLDNFLVGHNGGIYLGDFGTALRPTARPRFKPPGTDVYLDAEAAEERLRTGGGESYHTEGQLGLGDNCVPTGLSPHAIFRRRDQHISEDPSEHHRVSQATGPGSFHQVPAAVPSSCRS